MSGLKDLKVPVFWAEGHPGRRILCPYLWGYKSAKSVVSVELMDHYVSGFRERLGCPDDAEIEAGKVRDMNSGGRLRPIPAGEVIDFLDG